MILPFEKIFVLSLVETPERLENFWKEMSKLNVENKINVWHSCKHPYAKEISWYLKSNHNFYWNGKGNGGAFNCTREHYGIVKYSYYSNFNSILIFEDDFCFQENIDKIKDLFSKPLPETWNLIHYGYGNILDNYKLDHLKNTDSNYFYKDRKELGGVFGTSCYALSRPGMKYYIDTLDNRYGVADSPFFRPKLENSFITNYSIYYPNENFITNIQ